MMTFDRLLTEDVAGASGDMKAVAAVTRASMLERVREQRERRCAKMRAHTLST